MILSTTKTIARLPHLATFLADSPDAVAGWGCKPSGRRARWLSRLLLRPLALLEDGFIRSVERHESPISLLVDHLGVYYDASRASSMERLIAAGTDADAGSRARKLAAQWRVGRISKYNHADDYRKPLPDRYVLVVDQIAGDLSVSSGLASPESFLRMLSAASIEHPDATIVVKIHPDVHIRARRGYFDPALLDDPRVVVIGEDCHCSALIEGAIAVYCVTSLMGFEAMLWGKPVRCFGMPFYAGWGLTGDEQKPPSRRGRARIEDLIHAALVGVARYADPGSGAPWQAEDAIAHVGTARRLLTAKHRASIPV
jgi:capsular polysaccharide export protein